MKLAIVRGTAATFGIELQYLTGEPYTLAEGERVVFGVCAETDAAPRFIKEAAHVYGGVYAVHIKPEDTAGMEPGRYGFEVNLFNAEGVPENVIEYSPFDIICTVTGEVIA